jgi:hypothetical protein
MKTVKVILVLVVLCSLFFVACGGKKGPSGPQQLFSPRWFGVQGDPEFFFGYGEATRQIQRTSHDAAVAQARAEIAMSISSHVQSMTKDFISEAGITEPTLLAMVETVTRITTDQTMAGSQIVEREYYPTADGRVQAFIKVSVPRVQVDRDFMNRVSREEELYTRFRASQAFGELDRALNR